MQNQLRLFDPKGAYEPSINFHLTLRYIGESPDVRTIVERMEQIECEGFNLTLHELGLFEHSERNVVWSNVQEEPRLQALQLEVDRRLSDMGIGTASFLFNPHISLAFHCRSDIPDAFPSCTISPLSFKVCGFHLYEVEHTQEGKRFRKLRDFKLRE
ncbi:hypothetical protein GCM10010917_00680 [Paenibacillus physcomitrellae]|uniref:2'-5' RNA ligase n=1 Tax=Paenibacillus physcomitrellae TaxID=1619311 RepID=A0ABQ1FM80_9BACL|nr:hypothetical protein GCM10010917_00680 [Paenibacillus physcomitrellae]